MYIMRIILAFMLFNIILPVGAALQQSDITKVVLLGTGTPFPNPQRSGPGVAIVVHDTPYLIDFGPGVIRQAAALSPRYGGSIKGLDVKRIKHAFLTHLHSDHTAGYPDLILTPWTMGRDAPLEVYGPEGIAEMTDNILKAYKEDIRYRLYGLEPANNQGWRVNTHTINEGLVYKDENVKVEAFRVKHGTWPNAFGFRFTTPDRVIVISGDLSLDKESERDFRDTDILIHEVYSDASLKKRTPFWQGYHANNHTSGVELGQLAKSVKPKLLVLYHVLGFGDSDEAVLKEVKTQYKGDVVLGNDLDIF
jgi:ribonuclease BN (tRNA processing enzyme)